MDGVERGLTSFLQLEATTKACGEATTKACGEDTMGQGQGQGHCFPLPGLAKGRGRMECREGPQASTRSPSSGPGPGGP